MEGQQSKWKIDIVLRRPIAKIHVGKLARVVDMTAASATAPEIPLRTRRARVRLRGRSDPLLRLVPMPQDLLHSTSQLQPPVRVRIAGLDRMWLGLFPL